MVAAEYYITLNGNPNCFQEVIKLIKGSGMYDPFPNVAEAVHKTQGFIVRVSNDPDAERTKLEFRLADTGNQIVTEAERLPRVIPGLKLSFVA